MAPPFDIDERELESRQLGTLTPEMRGLVETYVQRCAALGVQVLVYCTYRNERMQAIRYRRNRDRSAIESKAADLRRRGFPQLAEILIAVGPQANTPGGRVETNAGPGESFHQHGWAIDRVPMIQGQPLWRRGLPLKEVGGSGGVHPAWLTSEAVAAFFGLERLLWEHVHLQKAGLNLHDLMRQRYGQSGQEVPK